jgi:ABC-type Fe3+ transport system permease subunit
MATSEVSPASDETTGLMAEIDRYDDEVSVNNDENQSEPATQSSEPAETSRSRRSRPRKSSEDEAMTLKYGARHLLLLIVPVSICMLVVVATVLSVKSYASEDAKLIYIPYDEKDSSSSSKLGQAVVNTLVFLGIVVVMTVILVVLYKYRCYKVKSFFSDI